MCYVRASLEDYYEALTFKVYVTDALAAITNNVRNFAGGAELKTRWYDLYTGKVEQEVIAAEKSADEIALDVCRKAGLKVGFIDNG